MKSKELTIDDIKALSRIFRDVEKDCILAYWDKEKRWNMEKFHEEVLRRWNERKEEIR